MTLTEVLAAGGQPTYDFGNTIVYQIPIHIAYYDHLGIPKDKDGWDVVRPYKTVIINKESIK